MADPLVLCRLPFSLEKADKRVAGDANLGADANTGQNPFIDEVVGSVPANGKSIRNIADGQSERHCLKRMVDHVNPPLRNAEQSRGQ